LPPLVSCWSTAPEDFDAIYLLAELNWLGVWIACFALEPPLVDLSQLSARGTEPRGILSILIWWAFWRLMTFPINEVTSKYLG